MVFKPHCPAPFSDTEAGQARVTPAGVGRSLGHFAVHAGWGSQGGTPHKSAPHARPAAASGVAQHVRIACLQPCSTTLLVLVKPSDNSRVKHKVCEQCAGDATQAKSMSLLTSRHMHRARIMKRGLYRL